MTVMGAAEALDRLRRGNARWVAGQVASPRSCVERREELAANGQAPYAIILACSDSRVAPGLIFDAGLGDLFVVRVAGNVLGTNVTASVEYAVNHLRVPLLLVLGHTDCGAVGAALAGGGEEQGALPRLLDRLAPAMECVEGECVDHAAKADATALANVGLVLDALRRDGAGIAQAEAEGSLRLAGAIYHLESGRVEWLD